MAMNKAEITAKFEDEKLRVQEQSQLIYLQNQIDELRRMLKDQNNKYAWAMEQSRRSEAQISQLHNVIERQAQEVQTSLEVYKREIGTLRREVASALLRAEEAIKPVRDIQAQIHQLQESRRQDRDAIVPWQARIEELEHRAKETHAVVREGEDRYRQLVGHLEQLRMADSGVVDQIRHLDEQMQVEKQVLRRQAVEAQQLVADVRASLDDPLARITHLEERVHEGEARLVALPPLITQIEERLPVLQEDIRRVELVASERFLMTQERIEDLRHQHDERMVEMHEAGDQNLLHFTSWLERIDAWCSEEAGRVARIGNRVDLMLQKHETRIAELEAQELDLLHRISGAWNNALEVVKAGQVARRDDGANGEPRR